jgi:hypothetical protein
MSEALGQGAIRQCKKETWRKRSTAMLSFAQSCHLLLVLGSFLRPMRQDSHVSAITTELTWSPNKTRPSAALVPCSLNDRSRQPTTKRTDRLAWIQRTPSKDVLSDDHFSDPPTSTRKGVVSCFPYEKSRESLLTLYVT